MITVTGPLTSRSLWRSVSAESSRDPRWRHCCRSRSCSWLTWSLTTTQTHGSPSPSGLAFMFSSGDLTSLCSSFCAEFMCSSVHPHISVALFLSIVHVVISSSSPLSALLVLCSVSTRSFTTRGRKSLSCMTSVVSLSRSPLPTLKKTSWKRIHEQHTVYICNIYTNMFQNGGEFSP